MHTFENFAQNALDYKKVSWISSQYIVIINETLTPKCRAVKGETCMQEFQSFDQSF